MGFAALSPSYKLGIGIEGRGSTLAEAAFLNLGVSDPALWVEAEPHHSMK